MTEFKTVYCETCKKNVDNIKNFHSYVKTNGHVKKCNVCKWKDKHKDRLIDVIGYTKNEIDMFLYFFIYKHSTYINDIALQLNRSIDDMIKLFRLLKICNRKCDIKTHCEYCGKQYISSLSNYSASEYHYCCTECYYLDKQNKSMRGENSKYYNRKLVQCSNCNKDILVIPSKLNCTNRYGENHIFCCNKCYYEFRSKYYVGEKAVNYHKKFSYEMRNKMKLATAKRYYNMPKITSIQSTVNKMLDEYNIDFINEYTIKYYSIDNYLTNRNLLIEVMGDYWHVNPLIYNINGKKINKIQAKDICRDKKKKTYIKKYYKMPILYLWETDIKFRPEMCKKLIELYIDCNGEILNHNSFNWSINKNNELKLNEKIIFPYFELHKSEYQKIIQ